jgi:broad specificity phosphatase PhoE
MKITLIRHAQALHNSTGNYTGLFDPELTELGFEQCKKQHYEADIVICSTAIQTALTLFPNHQIFATDLLLEFN